jgi:hypothetical protein
VTYLLLLGPTAAILTIFAAMTPLKLFDDLFLLEYSPSRAVKHFLAV